MRSSIRLGKLFGIEIGLHYSWFLIALLITMSLGSQFQASHPEWGSTIIWALSALTAILFFVTLLAHEMSHAMVARARGLKTTAITLFALGGVAQIEKEPEDAKTEFLVGIVGPFSSAVIGLVSLAIAWGLGWRMGVEPATPVRAMFVWLGYINLSLAAFNMIPGYPLDGGRILRSILWLTSRDALRATQRAAAVGKVIALLFIAFGIFRFFGGAGFGGLWIAFIGWFLLQAATASASSVAVTAGLKGVRVSDVMTADCVMLDGNMNVELPASLRQALLCRPAERRGSGVGHCARNQGAGTSALAVHHAFRHHAPAGSTAHRSAHYARDGGARNHGPRRRESASRSERQSPGRDHHARQRLAIPSDANRTGAMRFRSSRIA